MSGGFVKIYGTRLCNSSLLETRIATRWAFMIMLAQSNEVGFFRCATITALARMANITKAQAVTAIEELSAPDPDSTTPDNDGRRITKVDGGYQIETYQKYREYRTAKQIAWAANQKASRARKAARTDMSETISRVITEAEAEAEIEADADTDLIVVVGDEKPSPRLRPKKKTKKRAAPWLVWDSEKEELRAVSSELSKRDAFIAKWSELLGSEDRFWYEKTKADKWLAANEKRRQKIRRFDLFLANTWFGNCLRGDE